MVVPYKFKDMVEKDGMYPPGWCHRKFFAPRYSPNPAKEPRKDDGIVQEKIREKQREEEGRKQADQDKLQAEQKRLQVEQNGMDVAASSAGPPIA